MKEYSVDIMIPITVRVEADSEEEAIEKAFNKDPLTANYGGDGICVTELKEQVNDSNV